jgi:hypothetical protein
MVGALQPRRGLSDADHARRVRVSCWISPAIVYRPNPAVNGRDGVRPFRFKADEFDPGSFSAYERNDAYRPGGMMRTQSGCQRQFESDSPWASNRQLGTEPPSLVTGCLARASSAVAP